MGTSSQSADRQGRGQAQGQGWKAHWKVTASEQEKKNVNSCFCQKKLCDDLLCCTLTMTAAAACRGKNAMGIPVV